MAAGREGRAERLNERLRGAQRANVDDSFSLDLGGLNIPSSTSPAAGEAPTSSSSRGPKLDSDVISAAVHDSASSARRRSARLGSREPNQSPDASSRAAPQDALKSTTPATQDATPSNVASVRTTRLSTIARSAVSTQLGPVRDELGTLPAPSYVRSSPAQTNMSTDMIEEVGESPSHAPGSGKRRRVPLSQAMSSSVRLLDTMASDDTFPASSSPLARRVRRSDATSIRRSTGSVSKLDVGQDADELLGKTGVEESLGEPSGMPSMNDVEQITMDDEVHEPRTISESGSSAVAEVEPEPEAEAEEGAGSEVEAEAESEPEPEEGPEIRADSEPEPEEEPEISPEHKERHSLDEQDQAVPRAHREDEIAVDKAHATDSTKIRGKKRQRPPREVSPELGSNSAGEEEVEAERGDHQPVPKRKRPSEDPTARKGPGRKRALQPESSVAPQAQEGSESEAEEPRRVKQYKGRRKRSSQGEGEGDDATIEITVQRFVHPRRRGQGDDDTDPLLAEIPFANHGGESVVDVFAQVCDEIITTTLAQLRDMVNGASDAAEKKEGRIKIRAIEAYREELNSRLLQHIIHLNHWHSLRRRVRHVQKEKMALREEIVRIRGEREQVALRMDAVRIKHEADSKESKYCLDASALMHDVDLAVEQGRDAPELSGKLQREAELANLELAVSRITQEASSASSSGGMLQQVKDFNAFLERAAIALETR